MGRCTRKNRYDGPSTRKIAPAACLARPPSRRASPAPHRALPPRRPALPRPLLPRPTATGLCAAALVAAVVPLAILQIPDAIAWSLPSQFTAPGPNVLASLLRAANLALPAMAVAAPFGALATRRFRAGPVLLAGLLVIGVADALGEDARTVPLIGVDRLLHGLGAGISMAAVAAIVAERRPAARGPGRLVVLRRGVRAGRGARADAAPGHGRRLARGAAALPVAGRRGPCPGRAVRGAGRGNRQDRGAQR
jgi:hypothetical protein